MKILAIIPARGGSKGVPRKNIKLLNGKPLIAYTLEAALGCSALDKVMVSTDDEEIAALSRELGAEVPGLRPARLATDASPTIDTVRYTLEYYAENGQRFDAVCLLQPTSPLRTVNDIEAAVKNFRDGGFDSLISVLPVPAEFNPHWTFLPGNENGTLRLATGETTIIPRRQELPPAYYRNGAIYLVRAAVVLSQNSLYGQTIGYYEMKPEQDINIDTPADWAYAEQRMKTE